MKKYENPEITISMFDANVATDGSAIANAKAALNATGEVTQVGQAAWGTDADWTITF